MRVSSPIADPSRLLVAGLRWGSLGAVLSLGVAWADALLDPLQVRVYSSDEPAIEPSLREFIKEQSPGLSSASGTCALDTALARFEFREEDGPVAEWYELLGGESPVEAEDYGWPLRAWSAWHRSDGTDSTLIAGIGLDQPRPVSHEARWVSAPGWALPVVPRLHLVAASGAVYGAAAWLGFIGARRVARSRRVCRGCCGGCGYDMSGIGTACPECGGESVRRFEPISS